MRSKGLTFDHTPRDRASQFLLKLSFGAMILASMQCSNFKQDNPVDTGGVNWNPPLIVAQPLSRTVTYPSTITFIVGARGRSLTYQWQRADSTGEVLSFVDITDATDSSYTKGATRAFDNGSWYRCVVTDGNGASSTTNQVTLIVRAPTGFNVYDIDGNGYHTVVIGRQEWMVENLKTIRFNDGTSIPLVTDSSSWIHLTSPAYCWYGNNSASYKSTYGALYNYYSVYTGYLAPGGWRVPTGADWIALVRFLGDTSVAGGTLKESGTGHWKSPNIEASNAVGFTAVPGGCRASSASFYNLGYNGYWWSTQTYDGQNSWNWSMASGSSHVSVAHYDDANGFSVRCIRDTTPPPAAPGAPVISSALAGDSSVTVSWSAVSGAALYNLYYQLGLSVDKATASSKPGVTSGVRVTGLRNGLLYAFAVSALNAGGESPLSAADTATPRSPKPTTITDIDGNFYHTVTIGTQTWLAENLRTTHFNDGTPVPLVTDTAAWVRLATPGYCWYNNDATTYGTTYGALYNWYAANSGKLAPVGWHVPSSLEWTALISSLGDTTVAGGKMKEIGTAHWSSPNTGATNASGFKALPGGDRNSNLFPFYGIGSYGYWWSTTLSSNTSSWTMYLSYLLPTVRQTAFAKIDGFSVRCLKD